MSWSKMNATHPIHTSRAAHRLAAQMLFSIPNLTTKFFVRLLSWEMPDPAILLFHIGPYSIYDEHRPSSVFLMFKNPSI